MYSGTASLQPPYLPPDTPPFMEILDHKKHISKLENPISSIQSSQMRRTIGVSTKSLSKFRDTGGNLQVVMTGRMLYKQKMVRDYCGATVDMLHILATINY